MLLPFAKNLLIATATLYKKVLLLNCKVESMFFGISYYYSFYVFFNRLQFLPKKKWRNRRYSIQQQAPPSASYTYRYTSSPRTWNERTNTLYPCVLWVVFCFSSKSYGQIFHYAITTSLQAKFSNKIGGFVVQGIIIQI